DLGGRVNRSGLLAFAVKPDELIIALPLPLPNKDAVVRNRKSLATKFILLSGNYRYRLAGQHEFSGIESLRNERVITDKNQPTLRRINKRRTIRRNQFGFRRIQRAGPNALRVTLEKKMETVRQKVRMMKAFGS